MHKILKALHLTGVVLFFGSILGHAVAGLAKSAHSSPETQLVIRQVIDVTTWSLTVPGLVLLVLTGAGMIFLRRASVLKMKWMVVHLVIAGLILLNAAFILLPTGQLLLASAVEMVSGAAKPDDLQMPGWREAIFGAINILLCLAALFVAVIKPRLGKMKS